MGHFFFLAFSSLVTDGLPEQKDEAPGSHLPEAHG